MDSQVSFSKKIPSYLIFIGALLFIFQIFIPSFMPSVIPMFTKSGKILSLSLEKQTSNSWLVQHYGQGWIDLQAKVDAIRHSDEQNAKLRLENANLKLHLEALHFDCRTQGAATTTRANELKLSQATGARVGRTLASISYKPPLELLPSQLYTLGVASMKAHENEKAAVIFSTLTGLEDNHSFKTGKNFLATGVAWYRVENYILADHYFDEVLKKSEKSDFIQFQAQARLWKALVAKKLKKEIKAQYWLRELIDHHPHAAETAWINRIAEGPRAAQSSN